MLSLIYCLLFAYLSCFKWHIGANLGLDLVLKYRWQRYLTTWAWNLACLWPQGPWGTQHRSGTWETAEAARCSHKFRAPEGPKGASDSASLHHRHLHYYNQGRWTVRVPLDPLWNAPRNPEKWGVGTLGGRGLRHFAITSRCTSSRNWTFPVDGISLISPGSWDLRWTQVTE